MLVSEGRGARRLAFDFALMAVGDLLVLYGINEGLIRHRAGEAPVGEALIFAVGLAVSTAKLHGLLDHASIAFNRAATRRVGRVFAKLQAVNLEQYSAVGTSTAMLRLTSDASTLALSGTLVVHLISSFNVVILSLLYFRNTAPVAAALSFTAMLLLALFSVFQGRRLGQLMQGVVAVKRVVFDAIEGLLRGLKQVKLHGGRRTALGEELDTHVDELSARRGEFSAAFFRYDALGRMFFFIMLGLITFGLPLLAADSAGEVDILVITILYVARPMTIVFQAAPEVSTTAAALSRIEALEEQLDENIRANRGQTEAADGDRDENTEGVEGADPVDGVDRADAGERAEKVDGVDRTDDGADAVDRGERAEEVDKAAKDDRASDGDGEPAPFESLTFTDVGYRFPSVGGVEGFTLGPLDFTVRAGDIVFVTGANGSGKSTFLSILTGLLPRRSGSVLLGEQEVPELPPVAYRRLFAAIFSDFVLFDELYGIDAEPERVDALLERMQLSHKVTFDGRRFSTVELSTGQRKRLAMVVALLQDRPVYVFDEWAADQDPQFREDFYENLIPELVAAGKTVIAVTHDDRFFSLATRRLHIDQGKVARP